MGDNWANWLLVIAGGVLTIIEVVLGAATGFDLVLVGVSLAAGGAVGLLFDSTKVGLFSAGALALIYLSFLRNKIRSRLIAPGLASNVDALIGSEGIVTVRIAPGAAGQVKVGHEVWRAVLLPSLKESREPGTSVTVVSVEGVTVIVR
jgi:membrane protein implicated in regulation of membrane protease activity